MKTKGSRFRWIACIATLLLLCIVGSDRPGMGAEPAPLTASQCTFVAEETAGGAVLTEQYAEMIHADHYAKDAMATVYYAQEVLG